MHLANGLASVGVASTESSVLLPPELLPPELLPLLLPPELLPLLLPPELLPPESPPPESPLLLLLPPELLPVDAWALLISSTAGAMNTPSAPSPSVRNNCLLSMMVSPNPDHV